MPTDSSHIPIPGPGELIRRIDWPAEQVRAEQTTALRSLIAYAKAHSPFYARRLSALDPATLTPESLQDIPPLTKNKLIENWDEIVTDKNLTLSKCTAHAAALTQTIEHLDVYAIITTAGYTGKPAILAFSPPEGSFTAALGVRWMQRALASGHPMILNFSHMQFVTTRAPQYPMMSVGAELGIQQIINADTPAQETLQQCAETPAECLLLGWPSALRELAFAQQQAGHTGENQTAGSIQPMAVHTVGEALLPSTATAIRQSWGLTPQEWYWAIEGGFLAQPCMCQSNIHTNDDLVILEAVDHKHDPVAPGNVSTHVLVTPLYYQTLPLIRYQHDDQITILPEKCGCGSSLRLLGNIHNRIDDIFTYATQKSKVAIPPLLFDMILDAETDILLSQVHQTPQGADLLYTAQGYVDPRALSAKVERALSHSGIPSPIVRAKKVEKIARIPLSQKLRRFLPLGTVETRDPLSTLRVRPPLRPDTPGPPGMQST